MRQVGIRELKQRTSEVLRRVREDGESVDVTYRGRVVARLVPVEKAARKRSDAAAVCGSTWNDWRRRSAPTGRRGCQPRELWLSRGGSQTCMWWTPASG